MISYLEFMYKYEGSLLILVRNLSSGLEVENNLELVIEWILIVMSWILCFDANLVTLPC